MGVLVGGVIIVLAVIAERCWSWLLLLWTMLELGEVIIIIVAVVVWLCGCRCRWGSGWHHQWWAVVTW